MFIKKIIKIKYVGKFKDSTVRCQDYKKYTLFYGGNGRGKTTLCAVLRSLQQNDPSHITKRRTFRATALQEVQILLDTGVVTFAATQWGAHHPNIHIFDQQFILDNVHTGQEVGADQRRNFYQIIVGPTGVALASEIDTLDARGLAAQTAINAQKKVLGQHVPKGIALETWLAIKADPAIATKITEAKAALLAAENANEIAGRSVLVAIDIPALPANFASVLTKGLSQLAAEASARVAAQIAKHGSHDDGETWLKKGLERVVDNACPFCGTLIAGNALIEAYQGYFSEAYTAHLTAIRSALAALKTAIGPAAAIKITQGIAKATADADFWLRYTPHAVVVSPDLVEAVAALTTLYEAAKDRMELKVSAPLETPPQSAALDDALAVWEAITTSIQSFNMSMPAANALIQAVKKDCASTTLASHRANLDYLKTAERRHTASVIDLVMAYWDQVGVKATATEGKEAKKAELDLYDTEMLGSYEADINSFLTTFNAPFKLVKCGKSYQGRLPQSAFCLQFDGHDLDVAANAKDNHPTFNTTLSAGDKSTFALSFFLAQLKRDPDICNKVVVFDDPFTSLDDFRREMTAKAIYRVGKDAAKQVIVFSHDKHFLDAVRNKIHVAAESAAIQISITKGTAVIEDWAIEREVKEGYLQEHMALCEYAEGITTDADAMKMKMRPLLEQYIRYRFPNQIKDNHWLGQMLMVIRDDPNHPLKDIYDELEDINEYTAPFHHNPNKICDPFEVEAHVKRTLLIVGGWQ